MYEKKRDEKKLYGDTIALSWTDHVKARYRVADLTETQEALGVWFKTPFGTRLMAAQRACCERNLSGLSGYRLGHLGVSSEHDLMSCFRLRHRFKLAVDMNTGFRSGSLSHGPDENNACSSIAGITDFETLPLPSDAIDVMVLHHVLDFSSKPHEVLNEAARVVTAGGHLVIVGFNPVTAFGLAKWPGVLMSAHPIWRYHSLRLSRVVDWLTLLGFEVTQRHRGFSDSGGEPGSESNSDEPGKKLDLMARAQSLSEVHRRAFYVLVANKRVTPLTPVTQAGWLPVRLPALAGKGHSSALPSVTDPQELSRAGNKIKNK